MSTPLVSPPPPDLSGYVDLRIFDKSDQDIIATAIAAMKLNLPGWIPREGNSEVLILESVALEIAEVIVAINRLPGAVVAALLLIAGVSKDFGAAAIATATFTLGDILGHTIPGGTRLYLRLDDGSSVTFLVEPPGLDIAPGQNTGTVSIIADTFTGRANGLPIGTPLLLADPVPFIESVQLATAIADGRDPETDNEWRDRGVARLSRLSDALVLPRHFEAAALEQAIVERALAIDLYDPAVGPSPGSNPGHITVAVLGEGGTTLSGPAKTELENTLEDSAVAVLDVHVVDITLATVPFVTTVKMLPGFLSAAVQAAVADVITAYVDPLTWQWGSKIRLNEMIARIDGASGVDYVVSVTINGVAGDYTLAGPAVLPKAGAITVTAT